ncbi:MAG: hypothetical protein QNK05_25355 [Myxococcota bacterium]|nr:hypothetical protein [Myxococcota bacterium]
MVVCAWCDSVITARPDPTVVPAAPSKADSHGICRTCLSARIASDGVRMGGTTPLSAR